MSEPVYNAATDTLIYVADSADTHFADLTAMGASPFGSGIRLVPEACPALGGTTDTARHAIVTGTTGSGKAFQNIYLIQAGQQGPGLVLYNVPTQPIGVAHIVRYNVKHDSSAPLTNEFAIKGNRMQQSGAKYGAQAPQFGSHNHQPWTPAGGVYPKRADGITDVTTYYEALCGQDDGTDDGIQPVGPWLEDAFNDGQRHRYTDVFRPHAAALSVDGVTKLTVVTTGDDVAKTATAVFSESMAGRLTNGQVIGLSSTGGSGLAGHSGGAYTVSSFDGNRTCTLTPLLATQDVFSSTGYTKTVCLDFSQGVMQRWVDGTLVLDVRLATVGVTPSGAKKPWCGLVIVQSMPVDCQNALEYFHLGGTQSSAANQQVTQTYDFGDGDPTNLGTLTVFTRASYDPTGSGSTATQLLLSQQPAGAVSGLPMSQQPVVRIADSGGATVTSDTSTVTATLNVTAGTGSITAGGTKAAVAGVASFAGLTITGTGSGTITFSDGSLTSVTSASLSWAAGVLPASKLLITTQPSGAVSGVALKQQPVVTVADTTGTTVTTDSSTVTAAVLTGAGVTITGGATKAAVSGVASFAGLTLSAGSTTTGVVLRFSDGALTVVDSAPFTVTASDAPPDYGITPGAPAVYRMARGKAVFAGFRRLVRAVWHWLTLSASLA